MHEEDSIQERIFFFLKEKQWTVPVKSIVFHINKTARICTYLTSCCFAEKEKKNPLLSQLSLMGRLRLACLHRRHVLIIHVFTEIIDQSGVNKDA